MISFLSRNYVILNRMVVDQSIPIALFSRLDAIQNDRAVVMSESQHTRYLAVC